MSAIFLRGCCGSLKLAELRCLGHETHQVHLVSKKHGDLGKKDIIVYFSGEQHSEEEQKARLRNNLQNRVMEVKTIPLKNEPQPRRPTTRVVMIQVQGVNSLSNPDTVLLKELFSVITDIKVGEKQWEVGKNRRRSFVCTMYAQLESPEDGAYVANCCNPALDAERIDLSCGVGYVSTLQTSPKPYVFRHDIHVKGKNRQRTEYIDDSFSSSSAEGTVQESYCHDPYLPGAPVWSGSFNCPQLYVEFNGYNYYNYYGANAWA